MFASLTFFRRRNDGLSAKSRLEQTDLPMKLALVALIAFRGHVDDFKAAFFEPPGHFDVLGRRLPPYIQQKKTGD